MGVFKNHWRLLLELFFGAVGVVGLVLFIFFPELSTQKRNPKYYVDPVRTVIINKANIKEAPLKVIKPGGIEVTSSVTAIRIFIWNDGKREINSSDILTPLRVIIDSNQSEILRVDKLRISRTVTELELTPRYGDSAGCLAITFRTLENKDGGAFQIIYEGNPEAKVELSGLISGKIDLSEMERHAKKRFLSKKYIIISGYFIIMFLFMLSPLLFMTRIRTYLAKFDTRTRDRVFDRFEIYYWIAIFIVGAILLLVILNLGIKESVYPVPSEIIP